MDGFNARSFALVFGTIYLAIGVLGFLFTGFGGFASNEGPLLLGIFEINPLHNIVHLLIGGALLAGARGGMGGARAVVTTVAIVYAVVGVLGFLIAGTAADILALNVADHILHLGTALIGFLSLRGAPATAAA